MSQTIGDSARPRYEFRWDDGSERTTDELPNPPGENTSEAIEVLATMGRNDPECDVELIGFE